MFSNTGSETFFGTKCFQYRFRDFFGTKFVSSLVLGLFSVPIFFPIPVPGTGTSHSGVGWSIDQPAPLKSKLFLDGHESDPKIFLNRPCKTNPHRTSREKGGEFVTWEAGALAGWEALTFIFGLTDRLLLWNAKTFSTQPPFLHQRALPANLWTICIPHLCPAAYSITHWSVLQMHLVQRPGKSFKDKSHGHWGHEMKYLVAKQSSEWAIKRRR